MKKKRILLVGGAGYVGGHITDYLSINFKNYDLCVFDNLLYEETYNKPVKFIFGDILDKVKLKKYLDWADVVVWMAAIVGDAACELNREKTIKINYESLKFAAKNFRKDLIFFSTCSIYGAQDVILDENSKTNPLSLYAQTKLDCEHLLKSYKRVTIFRLGTLFGLGDSYSRIRMDLVLNLLTLKALKTNQITVFGGEQYRPLLHVKELAKIVSLAIVKKNYGVYNIAYKNFKIYDLAKKLKLYFPKMLIKTQSMSFQDSRNYKVNSDKFNKKFQYNYEYDINYGIKEMKKYFSEHRVKDLNSSRFINAKYLQNIIY